MPEEIDYAARVQRGAALLDEKWPTWAQDIDLDTLDIHDGHHCVTAQYSASQDGDGDWMDGMDRLDLTRGEYREHGFNGEEDEDTGVVPQSAYDTLNALWGFLITERRSAAQPEASQRR